MHGLPGTVPKYFHTKTGLGIVPDGFPLFITYGLFRTSLDEHLRIRQTNQPRSLPARRYYSLKVARYVE